MRPYYHRKRANNRELQQLLMTENMFMCVVDAIYTIVALRLIIIMDANLMK